MYSLKSQQQWPLSSSHDDISTAGVECTFVAHERLLSLDPPSRRGKTPKPCREKKKPGEEKSLSCRSPTEPCLVLESAPLP